MKLTLGEKLSGFTLEIADRIQNLEWSAESLLGTLEYSNRADLCNGLLECHKAYNAILDAERFFDMVTLETASFPESIKSKKYAIKTRKDAIKALNDDLD